MAKDFNSKKLAESLRILHQHGEGLLTALYNAKHLLDPENHPYFDAVYGDGTSKTGTVRSEQPRLFSDQVFGMINRSILKRFPEMPELTKLPGYQALTTESKVLQANLKPYYELLADACDFTELAQAALLACDKLSGLNCNQHHVLTNSFFQLLCTFVFVQLAISELGQDRKVIVIAYNILHQHNNSGTPADSFAEVLEYIQNYEKPISTIQEVFAPMGGFIAGLLQTLSTEFIKIGYMTAEMIRKDGIFNITANMKAPTVSHLDDLKLRLLPSFNQFNMFVTVGFLCVPGELLKLQSYAELLKTVVSNNISVIITRSEYLNVVAEYENTMKSNNKLSKLKQIVIDNMGTSITKAIETHQQRREFFRYVLRQILVLIEDRPFLLGYKMPMLEAVLTMAREEVVWYLSHHDRTMTSKLPKFAPKTSTPQQPNDTMIYELLSLIVDVREAILKESKHIQEFWCGQLSGHYHAQLDSVITKVMEMNAPSDSVTTTFEGMIEELKTASATSNFQAFRLNFARLLVHFHSSDTTVAVSTVPDFVNVMNEITARTRYVDNLEKVLDKATSLKDLFYYRPLLQEQYEEVLVSCPYQIQYLSIVPKMASEFVYNCSQFFPEEYERVTTRSVTFAGEFLQTLAKAGASFVQDVAKFQITHAQQLLPDNALKWVPDKRDKKANKKQQGEELRPGYESELKTGEHIDNLGNMRTSLLNSVRAACKYHELVVHDTAFIPRAYLQEAFVNKFKAFLSNAIHVEDAGLQPNKDTDDFPFSVKRPSVFLAEVSACISAFMTVDEFCGFKIQTGLNDVLLAQIDLQATRKFYDDQDSAMAANRAKKGMKRQQTTSNQTGNPFLITYINWYVDYLRDKGTSVNAIITGLKQAVVSNHNSPYHAEDFTDPSELAALCQLIGPSGVRALDERLLSVVSGYVKDIKENLMMNAEVLQTIKKVWYQENKFDECVRKLKQMDDVLQKTINLGFILDFRKFLFDSLNRVLETRAPILVGVVRNAHNRYPPNIYSVPDFLALDNLANYAGILENVDTTLRMSLQGHCRNPVADQQIFVNLPYLYAAAFKILAFEFKSNYNVFLDALDNNGHCFASAINMLITYLVAITTPNDMVALVSLQKEFIQITAMVLLRSRADKDIVHEQTVRASYLVLLKFVQSCRYLTEDVLEEYFPYTIIRSTKASFFKKRSVRRMTVKPDEEVSV